MLLIQVVARSTTQIRIASTYSWNICTLLSHRVRAVVVVFITSFVELREGPEQCCIIRRETQGVTPVLKIDICEWKTKQLPKFIPANVEFRAQEEQAGYPPAAVLVANALDQPYQSARWFRG